MSERASELLKESSILSLHTHYFVSPSASTDTQGSRDWGAEAREISATFVSEVRPNPGNESATCSICGALLVCLSCGNHRDEATAHLAERVKELEQALERIGGAFYGVCGSWEEVIDYVNSQIDAALTKPAEPKEQK